MAWRLIISIHIIPDQYHRTDDRSVSRLPAERAFLGDETMGVFNAVGMLGFAVQLAVLAGLVRPACTTSPTTLRRRRSGGPPQLLWHARWTWRDGRGPTAPGKRALALSSSQRARLHSLGKRARDVAARRRRRPSPLFPQTLIAVGTARSSISCMSDRFVFLR